jgi:hypothetical protein
MLRVIKFLIDFIWKDMKYTLKPIKRFVAKDFPALPSSMRPSTPAQG